MPKTLAALPSNQYATILSLTFGNFDFAEVRPEVAIAKAEDVAAAVSAAAVVEFKHLEAALKNRFDAALRIGELSAVPLEASRRGFGERFENNVVGV